jgi:hypothetical protein
MCCMCLKGTYTPDLGTPVCIEYPDDDVAYSLWASQVALMVLGPLFLVNDSSYLLL